jgi:hypothetical protein
MVCGDCPNARRKARRMRSRSAKPVSRATSSIECRPSSIISRAASTRSCSSGLGGGRLPPRPADLSRLRLLRKACRGVGPWPRRARLGRAHEASGLRALRLAGRRLGRDHLPSHGSARSRGTARNPHHMPNTTPPGVLSDPDGRMSATSAECRRQGNGRRVARSSRPHPGVVAIFERLPVPVGCPAIKLVQEPQGEQRRAQGLVRRPSGVSRLTMSIRASSSGTPAFAFCSYVPPNDIAAGVNTRGAPGGDDRPVQPGLALAGRDSCGHFTASIGALRSLRASRSSRCSISPCLGPVPAGFHRASQTACVSRCSERTMKWS